MSRRGITVGIFKDFKYEVIDLIKEGRREYKKEHKIENKRYKNDVKDD